MYGFLLFLPKETKGDLRLLRQPFLLPKNYCVQDLDFMPGVCKNNKKYNTYKCLADKYIIVRKTNIHTRRGNFCIVWKKTAHTISKNDKESGIMKVRTDLAVESKEKFEKDDVEIEGVIIKETYDEEKDIRTTVVKIESDRGAKAMEKPKGTYITIEAPDLVVPDEDYHREISEQLSKHLRKLMDLKEEKKVLVAGLGNSEITPDALGPDVIMNLKVNRHIIKEYGVDAMGETRVHSVSTITPGVMAQTGMETMEILKGIVEETKPDMVVAIDALAARSTRRLNCTIQITDTGINPGSGVLNHRHGLNEKTLGVPVIAIGVPTVVDAATIVHDAVEHLLETLEEAEMEEFLSELITPNLHMMFVTPKDVDETIKHLSFTISEGLNLALSYV